MKKHLTYLLLAAVIGSLPLHALAQVKATATLKQTLIRIGDQTELTLKVNYKESDGVRSVKFPRIGDSILIKAPMQEDSVIGVIEVLKKSEVDKYAPDKSNPSALEQTQTLRITCFDSGYFAIPPFRFILNGDSSKTVETEAMLLQVNTVKADTTKAPKEIKPPIEEPFTFRDALPYLFIGLGTLAAIIGLVYLVRHLRKRPITLVKKAPPVPAHIVAFGKLEALREKKLWQEGKLKQYHSELSDILREYMERTFPVNAMELTTEEILQRFRRINIPKEIKEKMKQVMVLSDMVKFAKEVPLAEENELSMANAYEFVRATMPVDKPAEEQKEEQDNAGV